MTDLFLFVSLFKYARIHVSPYVSLPHNTSPCLFLSPSFLSLSSSFSLCTDKYFSAQKPAAFD